MKLNRKIIWMALVSVVLILVFGNTTLASVEEKAGEVDNTISDEMQAFDEEVVEPEPTYIQDVDEEIVEPEPTIIPAVTIIGRVVEDYMLISEQGLAYGIAETEAGDLMGQYVGEKVIAKGIISMADDQNYISVISFKFLEQ